VLRRIEVSHSKPKRFWLRMTACMLRQQTCFLSRGDKIIAITSSALVTIAAALFGVDSLAAEWPQWRGPDRNAVWHEKGIVHKFDGPQLQPRWRAKIANGYSGPTVANGRVYVTDRLTTPTQLERVHCFDAMTGQPIWSYPYECRTRPLLRCYDRPANLVLSVRMRIQKLRIS
jgi:outer membrane protein assembly factor BamB